MEAACADAVRLVLGSRFAEVRVLLPLLLRDAGALADAAGDPAAGPAAEAWLAWARLRGGDLDGCAALASDWDTRAFSLR